MKRLNETMPVSPWQLLSEEERAAFALLARQRLGFATLDERGRDSLDFREVSVLQLRDALARAYLAGSRNPPPSPLPGPESLLV